MNSPVPALQPAASAMPVRILNDVLLALRALDDLRVPQVVEREGQRCIELVPKTLRLPPETRLRLAAILRGARVAWGRVEQRLQELIRANGQPVEGEQRRLRIPAEQVPDFAWERGAIQDGDEQLAIERLPCEALALGASQPPLQLVVYLFNLIEPASLEARFGARAMAKAMSRQQAMTLFAALLSLEGKAETLPVLGAAETKPQSVRIPYAWSSTMLETIAYDAFQLYLAAVEPPRVHRRLVAEHGGTRPETIPAERADAFTKAWEGWLQGEAHFRLVPLDRRRLLAEVPELPLDTLALLDPVLG
jgi:hypothetical protein